MSNPHVLGVWPGVELVGQEWALVAAIVHPACNAAAMTFHRAARLLRAVQLGRCGPTATVLTHRLGILEAPWYFNLLLAFSASPAPPLLWANCCLLSTTACWIKNWWPTGTWPAPCAGHCGSLVLPRGFGVPEKDGSLASAPVTVKFPLAEAGYPPGCTWRTGTANSARAGVSEEDVLCCMLHSQTEILLLRTACVQAVPTESQGHAWNPLGAA